MQRVTGDDRCERLIPNPQADLAEQAVDSHLFDEPPETIASAQRHDDARRPLARSRLGLGRWRLTGEQAATTLGVSPRTADALWAYARAWLFDHLGG